MIELRLTKLPNKQYTIRLCISPPLASLSLSLQVVGLSQYINFIILSSTHYVDNYNSNIYLFYFIFSSNYNARINIR